MTIKQLTHLAGQQGSTGGKKSQLISRSHENDYCTHGFSSCVVYSVFSRILSLGCQQVALTGNCP